MQQENDFLLDTCFWLIPAIIIYLIYPIIYCIIWAIRQELESVALNFKRLLRQRQKLTCLVDPHGYTCGGRTTSKGL